MQEQILSRNISIEIRIPEEIVKATYLGSTKYAPTDEQELEQSIHRYAALGYNSMLFDMWAIDILERSSLVNVSSELKGYDKETENFHYDVTISFLFGSNDTPAQRQAMVAFKEKVEAHLIKQNIKYQLF